MTITRLSLVGLLVAIGVTPHAQPAGSSSVVGVWRVSQIMTGGPNPRPLTSSTGIVIFTQRHYSISQVTSDKPRPELPPRKEATDKQRADAYEPFTGQAGTYEIKRDEMTVRPAVSMNPNLMRAGSFTTVTFVREGNTLSITFKADENGPLLNKITMKYTLVE
jgi:lipocalin-like protein